MLKKTFSTVLEGPANALTTNKDANLVAVAGRTVFKIFQINEDNFGEEFNLRVGKNLNLNFSCNDVAWNEMDENVLATAATNGAVVTWNLQKQSRSKLDVVFNDHKRTVNKVCFHPSEQHILLSGSQDGRMKLFDLRKKEASSTFISNSESVRDVQFSPSQYSYFHFASVQETGNVEIWDIRRSDRPESNFIAHGGPVFACDWHPCGEKKKWLATAGRDKTIKVWDLANSCKPQLLYCVQTIASVARIKWRPSSDFHIGSCSLVVDFSIYVWDVKRPYVPTAIFMEHKDVTTGFVWKNDPHIFLSTSKDGTLYQHIFDDAFRPSNHYNPMGLSLNASGDIAFAVSDVILKNNSLSNKELVKSHSIGANSNLSSGGIIGSIQSNSPIINYSILRLSSSLFRKSTELHEQSRNAISSLMLFKCDNSDDSNDNAFRALSMDWFVKTAKGYQLTGKSIGELCEINSEIAAQLNRMQVSQTWKILLQMFNATVRSATLSGGNAVPLNVGTFIDFNDKNENTSRHTSGSTGRHLSGGKTKDQTVVHNNDTSANEEASDSSNEIIENSLFAKTKHDSHIESHKLFSNGDFFFGEADALSQSGYDLNNSNTLNDGLTDQQDWDIPREAFYPRHAIQDCVMPPEMADTTNDPSSPTSMDDDDLNIEDALNHISFLGNSDTNTSSHTLLSSKAPQNPQWPFTSLVVDMLHFYAAQGDVQTAVSILLVLGDKMKYSIEMSIQEQWYMSYIELLNRYQLWNIANQVIRLCPNSYISSLNQSSTTVYTTCGLCRKTLNSKYGWLCQRCKTEPSNCAVCHVAVTGLYVWCQGCAHGGHVKHIQQWLANNTLCPAGCGHHCEYT